MITENKKPVAKWESGRVRILPFPLSHFLTGLFLLLLLLAPPARPAEEAPLSEYEVKAALLLHFVRYSDWPAKAFPYAESPYVVGVAGRDPFGKDLEAAFEGKSVKGRSFLLKRVSSEQEMRTCHVLFVATSERRRAADLLRKLADAPVLTVGESSEFLDQGGMIHLRLKNESVRFDINLEPARNARLKLDANLLKVAASVRGKP
jgi:hypothetical protein